MSRTRNTFLGVVAVLLSPLVANSDPIYTVDESNLPISIEFFVDANDIELEQVEFQSLTNLILDSEILVLGVSYRARLLIADLSNPNIAFIADIGVPNDRDRFTFSYDGPMSPVPEPGTLALLGAGLIGMGFARRRKKA